MAELSQYQKRKQVEDLYEGLDRGQRSQLLELLLEDWAEALPKKGKDYGVAQSSKYAKRLEWLTSHWGTAFTTKTGGSGLRRMPLGTVVAILSLFALQAADSEDDTLTFGSLEDGSELADKVATGLSAMKMAGGEQVTISRSAYNQLQAIRREWEEQGGASPEASTKVLAKIFDQLSAMPSVKSDKEIARYESRKKKVDTTNKAFSK